MIPFLLKATLAVKFKLRYLLRYIALVVTLRRYVTLSVTLRYLSHKHGRQPRRTTHVTLVVERHRFISRRTSTRQQVLED